MEGNSNDSKGSRNGTDTSVSYSSGNGEFGQGAGYNGTSGSTIFTAPTYGSAGTVAFWMKTNFNNTSDTNQRILIDTTTPRQFLFYY